MGKIVDSRVKKPVGPPAIIGAIAGLLVVLGILYFIFLRSSASPSAGVVGAPPPDTPGASNGQPNMPQAPPGDTDKEHVGPDTSGSPH